jgi:tRNA(Ile)-lysidine synthase
MGSLFSTFVEFIREKDLVRPRQSVLLAVSGGVDSMVMLHLFAQARQTLKLSLAVAHVNHTLRGQESDEDEAFVRQQTEALGMPFYSKRVDTANYAHESGLSKQEAARNLRYSYLEEMRRRLEADAIATAHQANDNSETVLMNVFRGTGIRGLAGIPRKRDAIIRPLLFAYRDEIQQYAAENSIGYRSDSSNSSSAYTRNVMRLTVIPFLEKELGANVVKSVNEMSEAMSDLSAVLDEVVRAKFHSLMRIGPPLSLDLEDLLDEKPFVQRGVVLEFLRFLGVEQKAEKVTSIVNLCSRTTGSRLSLGDGWTIFRDRDRLTLMKDRPEDVEQCKVELGRKYTFQSFTFSTSLPEPVGIPFSPNRYTEIIDADRLGSELLLRRWKEGDWFIPLGFGHKKKLSDFFVDEKLSLLEKYSLQVLEADGKIVWVCGRRLDDRFKVTENTKSVVRLTYRPVQS